MGEVWNEGVGGLGERVREKRQRKLTRRWESLPTAISAVPEHPEGCKDTES